ncbi:ATP-binding protein [Paenibacillus sp. CC-CFT747]|nr:ATP-binding protein [Paenibacillus sp. CC-CFT747]
MDEEARNIAGYLKISHTSDPGKEDARSFLQRHIELSQYKIMVLDLDGKVLLKSKDARETTVDLHNLFTNALEARNNPDNLRREYTSFYPIDLDGQKGYLVVSGIPQPTIYYVRDGSPLSIPFSIAVFILLFYLLTKRKMKDLERLTSGLLEISRGRLDYRVKQNSRDELGSLANNINRMAEELQRTLEEERRAERTKNELITNVSHDLRTPLTLIMGYLRLLKDKNFEDEKQADSYISIAYGKSEKLKGLIDDLFEYTKLTNHGIRMHQERVCLNELLEQLIEELVSHAEENQLQLIRSLPAEKLNVSIDPDKMIRVFENLLTNAIKYSHKPGTVKVTMTPDPDGYALVTVVNQGDPIPADELPRLFDRFYRVDAARTSSAGGSGLGLAIAKSIVESHGGEIWAESEEDEVRFCVRLKLS